MLKFFGKCLDAIDDKNASPLFKVLGCMLWCVILGGFAACCLFFAYIFRPIM